MKVKTYPEIGTVTFIRNFKARRLIIRILKNGDIRVTMPGLALFSLAERFVISKQDWICKTKQKALQRIENKIIVSNQTQITNSFDLEFITIDNANLPVKGRIHKNVISIIVSSIIEKSDQRVQDEIYRLVEKALKIEALQYIPQRLHELAQKYSFSYSGLSISKAKTRWGSCSGKNRINISCHIMRLPIHLIDFILIHELCHTVHKNHGKQFHHLLEDCLHGQKPLCEKELKKYRIH